MFRLCVFACFSEGACVSYECVCLGVFVCSCVCYVVCVFVCVRFLL